MAGQAHSGLAVPQLQLGWLAFVTGPTAGGCSAPVGLRALRPTFASSANPMKKTCFLLSLLAAASCNTSPSTAPDAASSPAPAQASTGPQQAVAQYVQAHTAAFPGYEPVGWGQPVAYTKGREATIKGMVAMKAFDDALVPRNKALLDYKAALARHAPAAEVAAAKARYGKRNKYNDSLLVIANGFTGVQDTARLGTEIAHTYRVKNRAGSVVLDSATFVVYPGGRVEQL